MTTLEIHYKNERDETVKTSITSERREIQDKIASIVQYGLQLHEGTNVVVIPPHRVVSLLHSTLEY